MTGRGRCRVGHLADLALANLIRNLVYGGKGERGEKCGEGHVRGCGQC